jgi:quinol monooxygenase YgiN
MNSPKNQGAPMAEPIVFVSHFRIKDGQFAALRRLTLDSTERLRSEKPRTVLFLSYVDERRGVISFLHAFADAEAMDLHFEGADERSRAALEFIEPIGWEFYGSPSAAALETMRQTAAASGSTLALNPELVAGFLRLAPG